MPTAMPFVCSSIAVTGLLLVAAPAAPAAKGDVETVIVTGQKPGKDVCLTVAKAKVAQWAQPRIDIRSTRTFADGSSKINETVVTENAAYGQQGHRGWNSKQVALRQRRAGSPQLVEKKMGLVECHVAEGTRESGEDATVYRYTYAPVSDGSRPSGAIWISDSTELPLREEMQNASATGQTAVQISARYSYNESVKVPLAAERQESSRRFRTAQWLRALQCGCRPAW